MDKDDLHSGHKWSDRIYVRIKRQDIAYLRFLIEGYDNLAYMTVLDKYEAVVQLTFSPDQKEEVLEFIRGLGHEMTLFVFELPKVGNRPLDL